MTEKSLSNNVRGRLVEWLNEWKGDPPSPSAARFAVNGGAGGRKIKAGYTAWWSGDALHEWKWVDSDREIDLSVGLNVEIENQPHFIPLVAIELKTGANNTDAFDAKSAIYSALRELYPFVRTVLIVRDYSGREYERLMRNGRGFDYVLGNWDMHGNGISVQLLKQIVNLQLKYFRYWEGP